MFLESIGLFPILGRLSAFAAARLAKQSIRNPELHQAEELSATAVAETPYDGHHRNYASSSEDGVESDVVEITGRATAGTRFSSLRTEHVKSLEKGALEISLDSDEYATCIGIYDLELVKGAVSVYGAALSPGPGFHRIYAPSIHALPSIVSLKNETLVRISHVSCALIQLRELSPLFRNIWAKTNDMKQSFTLLHVPGDDDLRRSLSLLDIDKTTQQVLARCSISCRQTGRSLKIMAIGAKSSGKSTFNRLLCNTLSSHSGVSKVAYLDLDPGQPEFGPLGQLSLVEVEAPLLGPSFTHVATPTSTRHRLLRSHTIAAASFKDDPEHYLKCINDLLKHISPHQPLVVNTCGWISGVGAHILMKLAVLIGVTDLVVLEPIDSALVGGLKTAMPKVVFHLLPRQPPKPPSRSPAELRNMQMMAYFHQTFSANMSMPKWFDTRVDKLRPWIVDYDGLNAGIYAIAFYGQAPKPTFLAEVLDGSIAALVILDKDGEDDIPRATPSSTRCSDDKENAPILRTAEGLPYFPLEHEGSQPLDPGNSECAGLVLVRTIDVERRQLHLITPMPEEQIARLIRKQVALVRGGYDTPEWAYLEALHQGAGDEDACGLTRPWVSRREAVGVENAVWRLRHPPMSHVAARIS